MDFGFRSFFMSTVVHLFVPVTEGQCRAYFGNSREIPVRNPKSSDQLSGLTVTASRAGSMAAIVVEIACQTEIPSQPPLSSGVAATE
ncbi:hypothetical protein MES4922_30431 [Mesorhizobium ventifaucium]|uniref:Uncharacterized protein n=1 Tax=Mesorhizobium ventifaucium TaxID=666020 RepID=A0ABN8JXY3_9HYPH|nr:hypothetical protein MES4922_30431 [Mesorhizobium ventifaucium]